MTSGDAASRDEVELAHSGLIETWARFRDWLDDDREALLERDAIRESALEWDRRGRDDGYLAHGGERLARARTVANRTHPGLNALEQAYLRANVTRELADQHERTELAERAQREAERAQSEAERRVRQRTRFLLAVGILAVIVSLVAGFAFVQKGIADEQTMIATEQAVNARIRALAAQVRLQEDLGQDEVAALLASEAYAASQANGGAQQALALSALSDSVDSPFFSRRLDTDLGGVTSLAFSRDGGKLAAGDIDGTVQVWGSMVSPPVSLGAISASTKRIWAVAFDPTGSVLLTGSDRGDLKAWNVSDLHGGIPVPEPEVLLPPAENSQHAVRAIAYSRDGRYVAAGGYDGVVHLWRAEDAPGLTFSPVRLLCPGADGEQTASTCPRSEKILTLAFSRDGTLLAAGGDLGRVHIWSMEDLDRELPGIPVRQGAVLAVSFAPSGNVLAVAGETLAIELWDLDKLNQPCVTLHGHDETVRNLVFTQGGNALISGGEDETIRIWDLAGIDCASASAPYNRGPMAVLGGSEEHIWALAISPTSRTLASTSRGGHVRLWNLGELGAERKVFRGHTTWVHTVAFPPLQTDRAACAPVLASGDDNGVVMIWRQGGVPERIKARDGKPIRAVTFSPHNGRWLAAAGHSGVVYVWDLRDPCEPAASRTPLTLPLDEPTPEFLFDLAFSPDGTRLAAAAKDGSILLWDTSQADATQWALLPTLCPADNDLPDDAACQPSPPAEMWSVAFAGSGQAIAGGDSTGAIHLFDLQNPDTPVTLQAHQQGIRALDFSADGAWLASASSDHTVKLWDARSIRAGGEASTAPVHTFLGHDAEVRSVAISPDGAFLATGSLDQTLRLWNLRRPDDDPAVLGRHEEWVRAVAFSPDGTSLAASSSDAAIRIWTVQADVLARGVCTTVWRNLSLAEWQQAIGADRPYQPTCPDLPWGEGAAPAAGAQAAPQAVSGEPAFRLDALSARVLPLQIAIPVVSS